MLILNSKSESRAIMTSPSTPRGCPLRRMPFSIWDVQYAKNEHVIHILFGLPYVWEREDWKKFTDPEEARKYSSTLFQDDLRKFKPVLHTESEG